MKNVDFLLNSEPWIAYRTMLDLKEMNEENEAIQKTKVLMLEHPQIKGIIEELSQWPYTVVNNHKSAGLLYHKLSFLAEIGIKKDDGSMPVMLDMVEAHRSKENLFQLPMNIPRHFGGSGEIEWAWALCDAPLLLYSQRKMGIAGKPDIQTGLDYLCTLRTGSGWPCKVSDNLGSFRGPGKKDDPCPYATLLMLKLLALYEDHKDGEAAHVGTECLLRLWENSRERHPYMFYMGTDFRKLKVPFVWYDILHVVEVLSQFEHVRGDIRFLEMLRIINAKADEQGLFTPESEWTAWKQWDFSNKRKPSAWLTFLIYRINKRMV